MLVHERAPRYGAYLLRYWEVRSNHPGQPSTWRFTLEEAGTGERRGFRDLEALVAFLGAELDRTVERPIEEPSRESSPVASRNGPPC